MTDKKSVYIPDEIIQNLENETDQNNSTDTGKSATDERLIEKSVEVALENVNSLLKQKGLPGWDETETESITKLSVMVAKKRLPDDVFSNSPEIILGLAISSIAVENVMAYRDLQDTGAANSENKEGADDSK